jgi:hypothetical protein
MKRSFWLGAITAVAGLFATTAMAQQTRFYTVTAAPGQSVRFDNWLNYDESSCFDRGHPRFAIITAPKLGRLRVERARVTQQSGACAGKRLSVMFVYYVAGRQRGTESFSYSVVGEAPFTVNVSGTVQ